MLDPIDKDTPKDALQLAMKAVDARLVALGGGSYGGLGFKLRALTACGFEDRGRPDPAKKLAAYQKAIVILNGLAEDADGEAFLKALAGAD